MKKLLGILAICLILTGCGDVTRLDAEHYKWHFSNEKKEICIIAGNPYKFTYMKLHYFKAFLDGELYKEYRITQDRYRYPGSSGMYDKYCITDPSIEKYAKSNKKHGGAVYVKKGKFELFNFDDFSLPSINIFGESKKDKKIKELEGRIKNLERGGGTAGELSKMRKCLRDISMGLFCSY